MGGNNRTMTRKQKKNIWNQHFDDQLQKANTANRYRSLQMFDTFQPGYLQRGDKSYLNLCSNDYLGFASDPLMKEEAKILSEIIPAGGGASRLVTGNLAIHEELERVLAQWKKTEAALVFPSGFQTNIGLLSTLAGKGDAIFCDKINHASIIDGCRMSGAAFYRYKHNDINDLLTLLKTKRPQKRLIVTDGVFSMDGDIARLEELNKIAKQYEALLIIDEAHATGVLGPEGAGSWAQFGLPWKENIILMGTLSKAIGCQGGFVCASKKIIEYLTNFCRSFIYSTALSPLLAGIAHYNIQRIRTEPQWINSLRDAIQVMQIALQDNGLEIGFHSTPIISIVVGECKETLTLARQLYQEGIVAIAIRPPTVPEGTARLRISVSAAHKPDDLKDAATKIADAVL